jgi:HlyD family secretion protein
MMIRLRHLAAGAAPIAALVLGACGAATPASSDPSGLQTAAVEQRNLDVKVEASGTMQPPLIVDVKSKASGEVLKLYAETGDEVQAGKLLAEIDPRDVQNSFDQAQADLDVAKASLANATEQRKRADALRQSNVMTAQDYESATLQEANAKAQLIRAQTNLELAKQKLNDVKISAPISGTVITKTVEVGTIIASASQNVSGGTTLFQLANTDTMEVQALVDETGGCSRARKRP